MNKAPLNNYMLLEHSNVNGMPVNLRVYFNRIERLTHRCVNIFFLLITLQVYIYAYTQSLVIPQILIKIKLSDCLVTTT